MNQRQREALLRLKEKAQDRLGLGGWRIDLRLHDGDELPREKAAARDILGNYLANWPSRYANVDVAIETEGHEDQTPEEVLVHEVVHILLHGTRDALERLRSEVAPQVYETVMELHQDREELAVRRLVPLILEALTGEGKSDR